MRDIWQVTAVASKTNVSRCEQKDGLVFNAWRGVQGPWGKKSRQQRV